MHYRIRPEVFMEHTPITLIDPPENQSDNLASPQAASAGTRSKIASAPSSGEKVPDVLKEILSDLPTELPESPYRPAHLHERAAAFFLDTLLFFGILFVWALFLRWLPEKSFIHALTSPISLTWPQFLLLISTSVGIHFLYFILFETLFFTSPGKWMGGLSIRHLTKKTPTVLAIFLRNIFRVIDYPLFFITGIGLSEATAQHQRLGDLVARTVVIRKTSFDGRRIAPETAMVSSATRRVLAFFIDVPFLLLLSYGFLMTLPTEPHWPLPPVIKKYIMALLLNLIPLWVLFFLTLSESLFQTTLGKAVVGLKVIQEDGRPSRFPTLLIRNLSRVLDMNPLGYFFSVLSLKKQRGGDVVSGTLVIQNRQHLRGWLSIPFTFVVCGAVLFLGSMNPQSFLKKDYLLRWNVFPASAMKPYRLDLSKEGLKKLY